MGRRLGQHFLSDRSILDRIVDAIEPEPGDVVLEIGPGKGTLTARLAPRVGRVIAVEKDAVLAAKLREEGRGKREEDRLPNVEILEADALTCDWAKLVSGSTPPSSLFPLPSSLLPLPGFKVIGNIPYYITSPLIEKALTPPPPRVIVFLVQREFADRLAAEPGSKTYGALTAGVQAVARVERLFTVRRGAFQPPPRVDSAVVRLKPLGDPLVGWAEHGAFRVFLASLFSQRRKQMVRSLRFVTGEPRARVEELLERLRIDPEARPEVLAPERLVAVFRAIESLTRPTGGT